MKYKSVTNPVWANQEQTAIECVVDFEDFGPSPFSTTANADTGYGVEIFNDCIAEKYGPVKPYTPPPPYINTASENYAEAQRRLAATDWVNQPDVYDTANTPHLTNRAAFLTYRLWVRGIAVTPTEGNLDWPTEPTAVWSA
jgi:hypothetical protein